MFLLWLFNFWSTFFNFAKNLFLCQHFFILLKKWIFFFTFKTKKFFSAVTLLSKRGYRLCSFFISKSRTFSAMMKFLRERFIQKLFVETFHFKKHINFALILILCQVFISAWKKIQILFCIFKSKEFYLSVCDFFEREKRLCSYFTLKSRTFFDGRNFFEKDSDASFMLSFFTCHEEWVLLFAGFSFLCQADFFFWKKNEHFIGALSSKQRICPRHLGCGFPKRVWLYL